MESQILIVGLPIYRMTNGPKKCFDDATLLQSLWIKCVDGLNPLNSVRDIYSEGTGAVIDLQINQEIGRVEVRLQFHLRILVNQIFSVIDAILFTMMELFEDHRSF